MPEEKLSQLTAEEFLEKWKQEHILLADGDLCAWYLEFAEAYAAHRDEESAKLIEEDGNLLRRAAELLFWPAQHLESTDCIPDKAWFDKRDQWMRDAGWEKKRDAGMEGK